jgi:hypothetical protein
MAEDNFVMALFSQNPALFELLDVVGNVPVAAVWCHQVSSALLCFWIGEVYAQRIGRKKNKPISVSPGMTILLRFLKRTKCLPYPMNQLDLLLPFATAEEFAQVLLACWKMCTRFPPQDSEYDDACVQRTLPEEALTLMKTELLLPFKLCVADHIDDAAQVAAHFL